MEKHDPSYITEIAGQVLSEQLGKTLRLGAEKIFPTWGSVVVRCCLIDGPSDLPRRLIIKKVREDTIRYAPDSPEVPNSAHGLFNDWAAAKFLGEIQ
ncbi:MAG TPA: hypothetical protein VJ302_02565, partial [Blastocatellia bacterium]|nr:hypothetical protein [Blastocatellia bacterium]